MSEIDRKAIICNWTRQGTRLVEDQACRTANHLIEKYLEATGAVRDAGWTVLYRDPAAGLFWEAVFLQSEYQGGGPPSLIPRSRQDVRTLYGFGRCGMSNQIVISAVVEPSLGDNVRAADDRFAQDVVQAETARADTEAQIIKHLVSRHLMPLSIENAVGPVVVYIDPTTGNHWKPEPNTEGKMDQLIMLSQDEADILYEPKPTVIRGKTVDDGGVSQENQAARIVRHLIDLHLLSTGLDRDVGSVELYHDPVSWLYWELVHDETETSGQGPSSLVPVTSEQVASLYQYVPKPAPEFVAIEGNCTQEDGRDIEDQSLRILNHLVDCHLVGTGGGRVGGWIELYLDPSQNKFWERRRPAPEPGTPFSPGLPSLVRMSHNDVEECYGFPLQDTE